MFNVIVPMAGNGSRFMEGGVTVPKPFIMIDGLPMFFHAIKNFLKYDCHFVFIVKDTHLKHFDINSFLSKYQIKYKIIVQDTKSFGPANTISLCEGKVEELPTFFVDCDQDTVFDVSKVLDFKNCSGVIVTFKSNLSIYSYVKTQDNHIKEIKEKYVISDDACSGIYFWSSFNEYLKFYKKTDWSQHLEEYMSAVYKTAIDAGQIFFSTPSDSHTAYGRPLDLENKAI